MDSKIAQDLLRIERERFERRQKALREQFQATIKHFDEIVRLTDEYHRRQLSIIEETRSSAKGAVKPAPKEAVAPRKELTPEATRQALLRPTRTSFVFGKAKKR